MFEARNASRGFCGLVTPTERCVTPGTPRKAFGTSTRSETLGWLPRISPPAVGGSARSVTSVGGEPSRAHYRSLGHPDHELAPLRGDERADRGLEQSDQANQTSSVRVPKLRQLPNPSTPIRRKTQLETPHHHHSPLISDVPVLYPAACQIHTAVGHCSVTPLRVG